jgi:hypothetical protein
MGLFKKKNSLDQTPVAEQTVAESAVAAAEGLYSAIIAVITAAISAYEGESVATSDLIIRKINRTAGVIPAWGVAGNREQIDTRRM